MSRQTADEEPNNTLNDTPNQKAAVQKLLSLVGDSVINITILTRFRVAGSLSYR